MKLGQRVRIAAGDHAGKEGVIGMQLEVNRTVPAQVDTGGIPPTPAIYDKYQVTLDGDGIVVGVDGEQIEAIATSSATWSTRTRACRSLMPLAPSRPRTSRTSTRSRRQLPRQRDQRSGSRATPTSPVGSPLGARRPRPVQRLRSEALRVSLMAWAARCSHHPGLCSVGQ